MRAKNNKGFALIIALSLMAFVLMLIMSLTTLIRVEVKVSEGQRNDLLARQNAVLAAHLALADLQKNLGPDQRITATARRFDTNPYDDDDLTTDITDGIDPVLQNWTGVWETERHTDGFGQTSFKTWLVSGLEETEKADSETILNKSMASSSVVTFLDSQNQVSVDKVPFSTDSNAPGSYAYWVSDDSVKARTNLKETQPDNPSLSAQSFGIGHVLDYESPFDTLSPDALSRILSHDSFKILGAGGAIDSHFHDVAYHGMGVLCDTLEGGLKRDLTDALFDSPDTLEGPIFEPIDGVASLRDPGGPEWESLIEWANKALVAGELPVEALSATNSMGYSPVVTGFQIFWIPSYDAVTGAVRLNLMPAVTLWNPYDKPLEAQDYTIQFGSQQYNTDKTKAFTDYDCPWLSGWSLKIGDQSKGIRGLIPGKRKWPLTFYLESEVLQPGEAVVFGPPMNHTVYDFEEAFSDPATATLVPGYNPGYSFYIDTGLSVAPSDPTPECNWASTTGGRTMSLKLYLGKGDSTPLQVSAYHPIDPLVNLTGTQKGATVPLSATPSGGPIQDLTYVWGIKMLRTFIQNELSWNASKDLSLPSSYNWLAHHNPRAFYNGPTPTIFAIDYNTGAGEQDLLDCVIVNPSFIATRYWTDVDGGMDRGFTPFDLDRSVTVGYSEGFDSFADKTILFQSAPDRSELHSVGQLSHAPLYPYFVDEADDRANEAKNLRYARFGNLNPAYAIGNSLADPRIELNQTSVDWEQRVGTPPHDADKYTFLGVHHDLSYKLNDALWDDYFFSAREEDGTKDATAPVRLAEYTEAGQGVSYGFRTSARSLMIDGPFNINSTSVAAWKALLSSFEQSKVIRQDETEDAPLDHSSAFTRIDHPYEGPVDVPGGAIDKKESYLGYRSLRQNEIQQLAEKIVEEVKLRGPFSSVAEFVNRMPNKDAPEDRPPEESLNAFRLCGALSAAIEKAGINSGFEADPSLETTPSDLPLIDPEAEQGWRAENLPGWLSQADILSRVGNVLTARSDSFTIYAYGESINPVNGEVYSKQCKMVVQRIPSYVDSAGNVAETPLDSVLATSLGLAPLNSENETFGRRFVVVSFEWVEPS